MVEFLSPAQGVGGGERIVAELLREVPSDLDVCRVHWGAGDSSIHDDPDLWLLIDVFNSPAFAARPHRRLSAAIPGTAPNRYLQALTDACGSERPVVLLSNAFVDVCDRPYLPCAPDALPSDDRCTASWVSPGRHVIRSRLNVEACFASLTRSLLGRLDCAYFLSPLHRDTFCEIAEAAAGVSLTGRTALLRPTIDPTFFEVPVSQRAVRDIEWLFVGSFTEAKGAVNVLERVGAQNLVVVGAMADAYRDLAFRHVPWASQVEVRKWMWRSKRLIHLPVWPEPFGRVVAEAALAGCEIVGNDNVGALSWDRSLVEPAFYAGAAREFWTSMRHFA